MRKISLCLLAPLLLVACGNSNLSEIVVDTPSPGQMVSSPLFVSGQATGSWFFEGSFPVHLVGADGGIISSGIVQAKSEWTTPELVEFEGYLDFSTNQSSGKLILKNDNPSGLAENDVEYSVPVKFKKIDQEDLVENYIRENISELNPSETVLGGSWYVLEVEFLSENEVRVLCEDGHIQSVFTANYAVDENQNVILSGVEISL